MKLIVGVGDCKASADSNSEIKTFALGSCVAIIILDPKTRVGAMAHIALPDSNINLKKAAAEPFYFADTGIPMLFKQMAKLGSMKHNGYIVKLIGGAKVMQTDDHFDIGARNINTIRKILWQNKLLITAEDVGANHSRTVSLDMSMGKITISAANGEKWSI